MEDKLNILANGRRPQYFGKWNTTLIFCRMEDTLNSLANWKTISTFRKWKMTSMFWLMDLTSIFWQMEDDINLKLEDELILFAIGR